MTPRVYDRRPRAPRSRALAAAPLALAALSPGAALAAPPGEGHESLYVLQIADADAIEQARALSTALRQRVNESTEYALGNSTSSLEALASRCAKAPLVSATGGFREPSRACQDQVGTSLRLGSLMPKPPYVWGLLYRSTSPPGRLVLRVHLWREGRDDVLVEQPYDEALVDPKSPSLVDLSEYLLQRLLRGDEVGRARVTAPVGLAGELWVDGVNKGRIEPGGARELALGRGAHSFEVRDGGRVLGGAKQAVGAGQPTDVALAPLGPAAAPALPEGPLAEGREEPPPRPPASSGGSALPWALVGVGAASLVASGVFFLQERSASNKLDDLCASDCPPRAQDDIDRSKLYGTLWPVALGVGAAGLGAGAYFLLTKDEKPTTARAPLRVVGSVQPLAGGAAAGLSARFLPMRRRSSLWAALAAAPAALASGTGACGTDLSVDRESFCRERPQDSECAGAGGAAGGGPGGGSAGQPLRGSGGGGPLMGTGGSSGSSGGSSGSSGSSGGSAGAGGAGGSAGCGDTQVDANNCGECGRACLGGGPCEGGACVPQTVEQGLTAPYALAVDATNVYWSSPVSNASGGAPFAVSQKAKDGSGQRASLLFTSPGSPRTARVRGLAFASLSSADRFVVVGNLNSDNLERFDLDSPDGDPVNLATNQETIGNVAAAGNLVFWTGVENDVVRGKNVNNVGGLTAQVAGQDSPDWLALDAQDGARPYWVANGEVRRLQPGTNDESQDVVEDGDPIAVSIAEGTLYWADRAAGELRSAPLSGNLPTAGQAFVDGAGRVEGFAVDAAGGRVYWVSFEPTGRRLEVYRAGLDGQNKFLLGRVPVKGQNYAGNPFGAAYVALDGEAVYFADAGTVNQVFANSADDGVVYRVAK